MGHPQSPPGAWLAGSESCGEHQSPRTAPVGPGNTPTAQYAHGSVRPRRELTPAKGFPVHFKPVFVPSAADSDHCCPSKSSGVPTSWADGAAAESEAGRHPPGSRLWVSCCLPGVWRPLPGAPGSPFQAETLPSSFSCCNPHLSIHSLSWTRQLGARPWVTLPLRLPDLWSARPPRQENSQSCGLKFQFTKFTQAL